MVPAPRLERGSVSGWFTVNWGYHFPILAFGTPNKIRTYAVKVLNLVPLTDWAIGAFIWCVWADSNHQCLPRGNRFTVCRSTAIATSHTFFLEERIRVELNGFNTTRCLAGTCYHQIALLSNKFWFCLKIKNLFF